MKRSYALFALGGVLSGVESKLSRWSMNRRDLDWRPAQATVAVEQLLHGTTPKPTTAPRAPGAALERSLDKRSTDDNTCAYISGITASSLYCDPDNACVYNSILSAIGCCADAVLNNTSSATGTSAACPVWTTCLDMTESTKYTTDNGFTMYCAGTSFPQCIKHLYRGDPPFSGYTLWGCAKEGASRTDFVYYTPTVLSTTSSSSTRTSTTSTDDDDTTSSTSSPTGTADPTPSPVPPPAKKSNTGAIVGGVVGGVGGLALIGAAAFFLLRRKKSSDAAAPAAAAAPTGPTSPTQGDPYDPNQPQMAQQQGGQYPFGAAAGGFAPVDPRASIAKPPFAVQQTEYYQPNQFSPPGSPPPPGSPGSPAPAYNGPTPPPAGVYGQQPDHTGYGVQPGPQPYQAGQYNQPSPPQGQQPYGHPTQFAAELPTQRGDGEVRELA